jgi:hypothetical protein
MLLCCRGLLRFVALFLAQHRVVVAVVQKRLLKVMQELGALTLGS